MAMACIWKGNYGTQSQSKQRL